MATIIRYNGVNPFGTRTPLVALDEVLEDNNGYITRIERYTLSGTRPRPSCNATFFDYTADMNALMAFFQRQFKLFEIVENGNVIHSFDKAIIKSISFPESSFKGFYEYEIVIDHIQSFEDLGVVDPQETYETSQDDSPVTTIKHSISCRGVGPDGVENAARFVEDRRVGIIPIAFAGSDNTVLYPATLSRVFSINRLTAEVSLTTTYIYNEEDVDPQYSYSVLTYTCELSETPEGTTITIAGNLQGNAVDGDDEMEQARYRFENMDWQAIAQMEWENWGGQTSLGENILFSVNENPLTAQVNFSLGWNSTSQEGPYIQDSITVMQNYEGGATCFRYQGTVRADTGCAGQRFAAVESLFNMTDFRTRAMNLWNLYGTGETISPEAKSLSVGRNEFAGTMTFEMTLCHDAGYNCGCAENLIYNFDFVESIQQYAAQPILRGQGRYAVQNLGFKNRRKFSIKGGARRVKCCTAEQSESAIRNRMNFLVFQYFPVNDRILELAQIDQTEYGDTINFNFSWSGAA